MDTDWLNIFCCCQPGKVEEEDDVYQVAADKYCHAY